MNNQIQTIDWWPSPAKINLFLHILGRYDNGYHQLQTYFQLLDQGDRLGFHQRTDNQIILTPSIEGVPDEDNLIYRAAQRLREEANVDYGIEIHIDKQLPMGGGIGGGSSNAATTLVALNAIWKLNYPLAQLESWGLSLGADVPIFVRGLSGFAGGVGENITPHESEENVYLIVTPNVHVSTADIFKLPNLPRNTPSIEWSDYTFDQTHNDCQEIVVNRHPEVAKLLQWLLHYAPSRMTGTGASVFAVFDDEISAHSVQQKLPAEWQSFIAKGVNVSPLINKLKSVNV